MDAEALQIELDALISAALARVHGEADLGTLDRFIKSNWPEKYTLFMKKLEREKKQ